LDWAALFGLSLPIAEIVLRGSAVYWFLFVIFRIVMRRDLSAMGVADILVLVIVADAAQNAMAGGYESITDGLILISTIVSWNAVLDWMSYKFPAIRRVTQPSTLLLVANGRIRQRNLRQEMMSVEELMAKLREHGVERVDQVKRAYMESDGTVTVIKRKAKSDAEPGRPRRATVSGD
jgi:uncharacterized membrane protein YcaP (DUF421 family)